MKVSITQQSDTALTHQKQIPLLVDPRPAQFADRLSRVVDEITRAIEHEDQRRILQVYEYALWAVLEIPQTVVCAAVVSVHERDGTPVEHRLTLKIPAPTAVQ